MLKKMGGTLRRLLEHLLRRKVGATLGATAGNAGRHADARRRAGKTIGRDPQPEPWAMQGPLRRQIEVGVTAWPAALRCALARGTGRSGATLALVVAHRACAEGGAAAWPGEGGMHA